MRSLRLAASLWFISAVSTVGLVGCRHETTVTPDGGTQPEQVTALAKDLIENHSGDQQPTTLNDKTFAADSQDPNAFPASFFSTK